MRPCSSTLILCALLTPAIVPLSATEMVQASREVWKGGEGWTVYWPTDKGAPPWSIARINDRIEISVGAYEQDLELPFFEPHLKGAVQIAGGQTLTQEVELLEGDGVELGLSLVDSQNELIIYKRQPLVLGKQTLTWSLADSEIQQAWPMGGPGNRKADGTLKPWEQTVVRKAGGKPAKLRWGPAQVQELKPLIDSVATGLTTGHPVANLVLLPEAREKPRLTITNSAQQPVQLRYQATIRGWNRTFGTIAQDLNLPAGGTQDIALPDTGKDPGIRWVESELIDGEYRRTEKTSFALMKPEPGRRAKEGEFLFSICTHGSWYSDAVLEREYQLMSLIGNRLVRDFGGWNYTEPVKGSFVWEPTDRVVRMADKYQIELQGNIGGTPGWAAPEGREGLHGLFSAPVRGWDQIHAYAEAVAKRYAGTIRYWEIHNEPDLQFFWNGTADEYLRYLKLFAIGLRAGNPKAIVMTGGFSGVGPFAGRNESVQERTIKEMQDYFDVHAFHQHGYFDTFQPALDGELKELRSHLKSPKPLYFNETAMYVSPTLSEELQAEALYKKLLFAWGAHEAIGFTWYNLVNDGKDLDNPEQNFGMVTADYQPKAVLLAFNTLTTLLGDAKRVDRIDLGADAYGFRFQSADRHLVTGWIEKPPVSDQVIALRVGAASTTATAMEYDLMGVATPVPVHQGVVLWSITKACRFLEIRGADGTPTLLPSPIRLPQRVQADPGKAFEIPIQLTELPGAKSMELTVVAGVAEATAIKPASSTAAAFAPQFTIARRPAGMALDAPLAGSVRWAIPGTPFAGTLSMPVSLRLIVPSDGATAAEPVFRLDTRQQVINRFDHDPSGVANVWKGPKDLSASIWIGIEGEALVVRLAVDDDVQRQGNAAADMWRADSVQLGVQIPGQQGPWEFGLARADDGRALVHTWMVPAGLTAATDRLALETSSRAGGVDYRLSMPLSALSTTAQHLRDGIRFNLIVNDDDTGVREGWIQLAKGIGETKDVGPWPEVRFAAPAP